MLIFSTIHIGLNIYYYNNINLLIYCSNVVAIWMHKQSYEFLLFGFNPR